MTTKDVLEIQNLVANYGLFTDNKDVEGFMNTWVSPEEYAGYDSGAFGNMKTWQELKDFETHHVGEGGMANGKRHQGTNISIELIDDIQAYVTNDMIVLEVAEIPRIIATGRYNKSLVVKTDKGWKFKSRTLHIDSGFFKLMEQNNEQTK